MSTPSADVPQRKANRILVWMCVLIAVTQLGFGSIVPALPLYAKTFGVSVWAIGMAIAVYGMARFAFAVPSGRLADNLGRQPSLVIGSLLSAAGNIWCAHAANYTEFLIARFASGAGAAIVLTVGAIILADISTPERRGRMMAIYQGVFLFAFGLGPLPGGLLAQHVSLAAPFYAYAVASAIGALVAWLAIPETRHFAAEHRGEAKSKTLPLLQQMRTIYTHRGFLLVSSISFAAAFTRTGAVFALVPLLATEKLLMTASQVGAGFALASILGLVASYPAGVLTDRYGRKRIIVPSTMVSAAAIAVFAMVPSISGFYAACLLWGIATSISGAAPAAYAADIAPAGMNATAMSSFRMFADLGYVLGPLTLGFLADARGSEFSLWFCAALTCTIGLMFACWAPESHKPKA
jgi:MFS transporter, DHA1 family, multidrug resistance protein